MCSSFRQNIRRQTPTCSCVSCFLLVACFISASCVVVGENAVDASTSAGAGATVTENSTDSGPCGNAQHPEGLRFHVATFDFESVKIPLIGAAWMMFICLAKIGFLALPYVPRLFPESCVLIVVGVILGVILYFVELNPGLQRDAHKLNTDIFFFVLLPPIIIDAGYFMPTRLFFDQLGTILAHALLGTLLNATLIGFSLWGVGLAGGFGDSVCLPFLHAMVFASLLAAVDPVAVLAIFESVHVNEVLYIVIFGESLLNDGISIVLYRMFKGFATIGIENLIAIDVVCGILSFFVVIIGAVGIGIVFGFCGALISRFTHRLRTLEPVVVITVCYLAYVFAEMFHLSGILACTFCGIAMKKYVDANISHNSRVTIRYAMKIMATVSEAVIFMYLGIAVMSGNLIWNTPFILLTLAFCLIYRAAVVVLLTFFANQVRVIKMSYIDQFIMSYGGLRGAIAFALVSILATDGIGSHELLVTTTIVVIYFTNFVMGGTVKPLVRFLKVKTMKDGDLTMNEAIADRTLDNVMDALEAITDVRGPYKMLRHGFTKFNKKYLKKMLIRPESRSRHSRCSRGSHLLSVYRQLNINDALQLAQRPNTAQSLSQWNTSLRNLTLINRSYVPGEGIPYNYSTASFGLLTERTCDDSRDLIIPQANNLSAPRAADVNVGERGWLLGDSSEDELDAPVHWIPRRNRHPRNDPEQNSADLTMNQCPPPYDYPPPPAINASIQSSNGDIFPLRNRSRKPPVPVAPPCPGSVASSADDTKYHTKCNDSTPNESSESPRDGFGLVDERPKRRKKSQTTERSVHSPTHQRQVERSPTDNDKHLPFSETSI